MTTTDKLAEAARQYLIATAHLGACPGTRGVLERAIAEAEAKPASLTGEPAATFDEWLERNKKYTQPQDMDAWLAYAWDCGRAAEAAAIAEFEAEAKCRSEAAPAPAEPVDDPCLVLWQAMNEAQKFGNRSDDKLIVEFLRRAGYVLAAAPAPAPEATPAQAQQAEPNPDTADAERYRWLRARENANRDEWNLFGPYSSPAEIDATIDAARGIGASSGGGNG